ncbi:serine-rich protein Tye7p [[Candida] jaroonii]|uniref:Serine-rich protein Tye7p n=1 Tax=[Candida] jaroonii TaxID=467808 RepID=A0ACA9Y2I4_9ASCO|nr:serine-rich protein Tye7p [[Candida] jaroonii]
MSFKLNDYNSFLSSLYEKDTDKKDKYLDFDFGLNPEYQNLNSNAGGNLGNTNNLSNLNMGNMNMNDINNIDIDIKKEFVSPSISPILSPTINQFDQEFDYYDKKFNPNMSITSTSNTNSNNSINQSMNNVNSVNTRNSRNSINRMISNDSDEDEPKRCKSSHNVIEQRYRNKINDKFTALQNSVPTLRVVAKRKNDDEKERNDFSEDESDNDLEGLEPARKLNKGTILAKSIEYIKFLELKNNRMRNEYNQLIEQAKMLGIAINENL